MKSIPWLVVMVLLTSACKDDRSLGTDLQSGSRLRARYFVAPSGAEMFADWYDTELDTVCAPALATDGETRCLPTLPPGHASGSIPGPGTPGWPYYGDATCSERLWPWGSDCEAPAMLRLPEADLCAPYFVVYEVTAVITPTERYHVDPDSGACVLRDPPPPGSRYLALGPTVAPSRFVALAPRSPGGAGRLRQRLYLGEDGTRMPMEIFDTVLDAPCTVSFAADGALRCLPQAEWMWEYADAQCTRPTVVWGDGDQGCERPDYQYGAMDDGDGDMCTSGRRIWSLVGPDPGANTYVDLSGTCEHNLPSPGMVGTLYGWTADEELPPDSFVEVTTGAPVGDGRIRLSVQADAEGLVTSQTLWDETLQTLCRPRLMADGTTRCLPAVGGLAQETYADAACTVSVPSVWVSDLVCLSAGEPRYAVQSDDGCGAPARLYEVGPTLDGSPLYSLSSDGQCTEALLAGQFARGAEVPPTDLVELTLEQR